MKLFNIPILILCYVMAYNYITADNESSNKENEKVKKVRLERVRGFLIANHSIKFKKISSSFILHISCLKRQEVENFNYRINKYGEIVDKPSKDTIDLNTVKVGVGEYFVWSKVKDLEKCLINVTNEHLLFYAAMIVPKELEVEQ